MIINMDRRIKQMEYEITDLQQLSKCRELLLKKECVRIDFGNSNYIKKTGISSDQFNTICTLIEKKSRKHSNRTAIEILFIRSIIAIFRAKLHRF